jgi:hypothetical protein
MRVVANCLNTLGAVNLASEVEQDELERDVSFRPPQLLKAGNL